VLDALAALAAGLRLGAPFDGLRSGLEAFAGSGRRMEAKGEAGSVRVFDSYAHHPAEIAADLAAARAVAGQGRLLVVFQPHLVSRTRLLGEAMGQALGAADEVVVLEVYAARETPDPAVTGAAVAAAVPLPSSAVRHVASLVEAELVAVERARPGDLVLTLGAGDVTRVGPGVLARLAGRSEGAGADG
jgi:UDP-N-acetylmuramate--alanine ligase